MDGRYNAIDGTFSYNGQPAEDDSLLDFETQSVKSMNGVSNQVPVSSVADSTPKTTTPNINTLKLERASERYVKEWVEGRGLPEDWVKANVYPVSIEEATVTLGYKAQSAGVWIEGECHGGQFRPDVPWGTKDGSKPKYRTPLSKKGGYDAIFPAYPGDPCFWGDVDKVRKAAIWIDGKPHVIVTEGGAKAIAGCAFVAPTVGLPGVEMGLTGKDDNGKRCLTPGMQYLAEVCKVGIIIAFDADKRQTTVKNVNRAQKTLADAFIAKGLPVRIATGLWDYNQGKGMDDFIQNNGAEKFREVAIVGSVAYEQWKKTDFSQLKTKSAKVRFWLDNFYADRLSFNLLKFEVLLDGYPVVASSDVSRTDVVTWFEFRSEVGESIGEEIGENLFMEAVLHQARQNAFHPVRDYLASVKDMEVKGAIESLANVLGLETSIEQSMLRMHLIGSVARIMKPGCKYDVCAVLFGGQGIKKTTFWSQLYGKENFTTLLASESDKDTIMKTHKFWALEHGELDGLFKKKDLEHIKNTLTIEEDTYRPPYERVDRTVPRAFVFVGSTNNDQLLRDDENRRYLMLSPTAYPIDLGWVKANRDAVWAEAFQAWESGECFWIETGTDAAAEQEELAKDFQATSVMRDAILIHLREGKIKAPFTTFQLFSAMGQASDLNSIKSLEQTFTTELKRMGFVKKRITPPGGQKNYYWFPAEYKARTKVSKLDQGIRNSETLTPQTIDQGNQGKDSFLRPSDRIPADSPKNDTSGITVETRSNEEYKISGVEHIFDVSPTKNNQNLSPEPETHYQQEVRELDTLVRKKEPWSAYSETDNCNIGWKVAVKCTNPDSKFYGAVGTAFREDGERCEVLFDDDVADVLAVSDLVAIEPLRCSLLSFY